MNTTTIADITARLQRQTQGTENADNQGNLADYVWMLNHQGVSIGTDEIWEQLCQAFEDVNTLSNAGSESHFCRALVYAVNGLLTLCLNQAGSARCEERARAQMLRLAWRINAAWDAVLAGDIESISQHVELEETARAMG